MITKFCEKVTNLFSGKFNLQDKEISNLNYGLEIVVRFLIEIILLFYISYYLNILKPVLVSFITFIILRLKAGGAHLPTYPMCLSFSLLVFISIGKFVNFYTPDRNILIIWLLILAYISLKFINQYAPGDTDKIPIKDKKVRKQLKNQSKFIFIIWLIMSFILLNFSNIYSLIFASSFGIIAEIMSLHPKVYNISDNYLKSYK